MFTFLALLPVALFAISRPRRVPPAVPWLLLAIIALVILGGGKPDSWGVEALADAVIVLLLIPSVVAIAVGQLLRRRALAPLEASEVLERGRWQPAPREPQDPS